MANTMEGLKRTFKQENTTLAPYRLVKMWTNADEVVAATADTDVLIWVTDESADATAGNPVGVVMWGIVKLTIASATSKGASITATTAGKGAATTTNNKRIIGILLETTSVSDQVAQVYIAPGFHGA